MQTAIIRLAGCPSHKQRDQESGDPDRGSDQKRFDVVVSQCFHNRREEVLEILGKQGSVLEQDEQVNALVSEYQAQGFLDTVGPRVVRLASIVNQTPLSV